MRACVESTEMEERRVRQSVGRAVVEQVATAEGVDPVEIPVPLYDVVDPDALDALVTDSESESTVLSEITFPYYGYDVAVAADGSVSITPVDDD